MRVYSVIKDFDVTPLNVALTVGDAVSKFDSTVLSIVGTTEWDDKAFYEWVGHPNSAEELAFVGIIPDPPTGIWVPRTPVAVPSGPSDTGVQGTWSWDGTYLYWCVATDTWVRWVVVTSW